VFVAGRLERVGQTAAGRDLSGRREVERGGSGQHQVLLAVGVKIFVGLPDLETAALHHTGGGFVRKPPQPPKLPGTVWINETEDPAQ